jgi:predicted RNase H-like nuclease (RuvC/YqgF family)
MIIKAKDREIIKQAKQIHDNKKPIDVLEERQNSLEEDLQQRSAEIEVLKLQRSTEGTKSSSTAIKKEDKANKRTKEALKVAGARLKQMHEHYDSLHTKNTIMLGKLTAMVQAGGFGNRGSLYRKELDSPKAPSLDELLQYEEQQ